MSPAVPDACSLSQPGFEERLAWIRREIPRARTCRRVEGGMAWEFPADPELRDKLAQLVALEADCCSTDRLRFALHEDPAAAALVLEVHGADADGALVELLGGRPAPSGLARLARAGGLGALGAFGLLCLLPMGLAAVAGAACAAPLAGLESPPALVAAALLFGALA